MMRSVCFLLLVALVSTSLEARQGKGKGHGKGEEKSEGKGHGKGQGGPPAKAFRTEDRQLIAQYYRSNPGSLPPGLAKRNGDLPPGLEKQLRRNGHLPPGLEKRLVPFPPEIESRLPPCPPEVRRGLIGGMAVMWDSRSGLILDATVAVRL